MWNKDYTVATIITLGFLMFGCTYMKERAYEAISQPDNIVEEIVEEIIETQTGWDVDLTPNSPE